MLLLFLFVTHGVCLHTPQASLAELPTAKRARYMSLGLPRADVLILADELATADFFDATMAAGAPAKAAANWIMGDIMAACKVCRGFVTARWCSPQVFSCRVNLAWVMPSCLGVAGQACRADSFCGRLHVRRTCVLTGALLLSGAPAGVSLLCGQPLANPLNPNPNPLINSSTLTAHCRRRRSGWTGCR
jgi:hypothetical protein